ncbi:PepSY-like domain-containing protein [Kaistella flava (ex Peng et al. 2021)]|nr:PepSY-like domain-containing protein [Kaistella flava (ex Peng et al. 2021)]
MKKLALIGMIALGFGTTTLSAQKKGKTEDVPAAVKAAFAKKFPGVTAKWENEHGKYEANFDQGKHETSALYNADGTLEETEMEIPVSQLPKAASDYILKNNLGKIKEVSMITKADGKVEYEAEVKSGDAMFTANGQFIKIVKD